MSADAGGRITVAQLRDLVPSGDLDSVINAICDRQGRLAQTMGIANAALLLASDESSYVHGTAFSGDGGIAAGYVTPG